MNIMKSLLNKNSKYNTNTPKFFVMLMHGRTGSSFLTETINSHPDAVMYGEQLVQYKSKNRPDKQEKWVRSKFEQKYPSNIKVVGFKTKILDILDLEQFSKLLNEYNVLVIHSDRNNIVKLAVSAMNGLRLYDKVKRWNSYDNADRPSATYFDVGEFDAFLKSRVERQKGLNEFVEKLNRPTLKVFYEDILTNKDNVMEGICKFLGIGPEKEMKTNMIKTTSDNLKLVIENYEELIEHYKGTKYKDMLEEVLVD